MDLTKINFSDSIEDAVHGDRDACEFLYTSTFGCFRRAAADLIGTDRVTDQVMREVYIRIFSELGTLEDPQQFLSWGTAVTRSTVIAYYKTNLSRTAERYHADVSAEDYPASVYDRNMNPNAKIDAAEGQQVLRSLLDVLPVGQRICVTLWAQNDSLQQITEKTGLRDEDVAGALKYAKQMIERRLLALSDEGLDLYGMAPIPYFILLCRFGQDVIPQPDEAAAEKHGPQLFDSILRSVFPQSAEADIGGMKHGGSAKPADSGNRETVLPDDSENQETVLLNDPADQETVLLNDPADQETVLLNDPADQETVLLNERETVNLNHLRADDEFEERPPYGPYDRPDAVHDMRHDPGTRRKGTPGQYEYRNPSDVRYEKPEKSGSGKKILIIVILCVIVAAVIIAALVFLGRNKKTASGVQPDSETAAVETIGDPSVGPDEILSGITFTGISAGELTDVNVLWPAS